MEKLKLDALLRSYPMPDKAAVNARLTTARNANNAKIVVLDDDPTGVQTVHSVYVYTDRSYESILAGFREDSRMFYILTNSRSFTVEETKKVHEEIARNIVRAAQEENREFILISRGDSTLRGHWPLETDTLKQALETASCEMIDGEIILPFFPEGGRYTADNIHYVADGNELTPAGETEFAKDKTFGYTSSDLREWVEEKSGGLYPIDSVCSIGLKELRSADIDGIAAKLLAVEKFGKVIVNAVDYCDLEVFCTALFEAMGKGRHFLFRTASALPKVLGGIPDKPLLTRGELMGNDDQVHGGLIIVGSHVKKTSDQLEELKSCENIRFVEFNQHLVLKPALFAQEIVRVVNECDTLIASGKTVAVYTRRDRLDLGGTDKEAELQISVKISQAVTQIVKDLTVRPAFIIAKGGITSSDIGVNGLKVKKALVLGQVLAGIPVWRCGAESRFPDLPYVIFPGNVGDKSALRRAVENLCKRS